jgi:hypothetical protein
MSAPAVRVEPAWLVLREPADAEARSTELVERLAPRASRRPRSPRRAARTGTSLAQAAAGELAMTVDHADVLVLP